MVTSYAIATPILHPCGLIKSSPIVLADRISVSAIKSNHLGSIIKRFPINGSSIRGDAKCIVIDCGSIVPDASAVFLDLLACTFCLNAFAERGALVHGLSYFIKHNRTHTVTQFQNHQKMASSDGQKYSIKPGVTPSEISAAFVGIRAGLERDSSFSISIRRFNAAVTKSTPDEKIIDLAICLESLFSSQNEIAFQFSIFNTLLSEPDSNKRLETYKLLKNLYAWRTKIVHGSKDLDHEWYEENWRRLVQISTLAILAKAIFLSEKPSHSWQSHLESLILGTGEA